MNNQTENTTDVEFNDDESVAYTEPVQEKDDPEPDVKENDTFNIRVSSGGSGSSSKSSTPSVSVTPSGILEVDPISVSNNTKINITVLYEVGESLNNGTVEIDIPSEFIVNNSTDIISISNNSTTVSDNSKASYDANNVLSVESLSINKAYFVNLTLTNYSVNYSGSYNFAASSMNTGKEMSNKVYATFTVYNDNAYLKNLSAYRGDMDPSFDSTVYNYNTSVDYDVEQIDVKAILEDTKATLKVNDTTADSGDPATVTLNDPGINTEIIIEVIAEDGETSTNYIINVSRSNSPFIKDAGVDITEGSAVFSYEFYNETGSLLTYSDALASPYLLNNTSSTVTLMNESGVLKDTITLEELGIDTVGNVSYQNVTQVGEMFNIANVMQWGYPTNITLNLTGGQGEYTWVLEETINLTSSDIVAFMNMVSTPPDGDLLDADAGSDFLGVLFTRDGDLYHKQIGSDETWSSETLVNGSASEGKIVVDSGDKAHVTYTTDNGTIAYRTMYNDVWTDVRYIGSNNAGECYWPDIDIDSSNDPHIIYVDTMGDTAGTRNQPDLMYASLNNGEFNKVCLASGEYDRDWKQGNYPGEKPPQIAMDDNDNRYYLYQWRTYSHDMYVYHDRGILVVGANTQSLGSIGSNTNRFDIYDLKIVDGKLYALYRNGVQIKANEMSIDAAGQITSSVEKVVFDANSAYSLDVASSDIVIGSKDGDNLRVHYNDIPQTATDIDVKGDAVSIVHMGGSFYAAYTDNEDGIIKVVEIPQPVV